ncbi:MAG: hypothetical protein ACR2IF_00640 [Terriglobales bacterium]
MSSTLCRLGRLFSCLLLLAQLALAADPARTVVQDILYRADGSPAAGTLLISWPAFVTADAKPVAAGSINVRIGPNGQVNIPLVPTQGATPAGTYYKVVVKLDEAVTQKDIVNADQFRDGLGKIIDGTVQCLNASAWAKK